LKRWGINFSGTFLLGFLLCACAGCKSGSAAKEEVDTSTLPFFGQHDVEMRQLESGVMVADTAYYTLPKFVFTNQFNEQISHRDYLGRIFVAEFFFSHCKSICPIMSAQMARLPNV
jgi:protein SCO1